MLRSRVKLSHAVLFCLAGISFFVSKTAAEEIKGRVDWPKEWTVFAPFDRGHGIPDAGTFRSVPDSLTIPGTEVASTRTVEGRALEVEPGKPVDLVDFFGEQGRDNVAYVFLKLDSPGEQTATLGMGGDWWLQAWVNGEEVFDTLDDGNNAFPPTMLNHTVDVPLREGRNVLVVRFITGMGSSTLALGGPDEFPAAERREAERLAARELNIMPERLEDRLAFPVDKQAFAMARRGMKLPASDADLSQGGLAGLQAMPERQLYFDRKAASATRGRVRDTLSRRFDEPVVIRLSRDRYPWEDRHLDAIVWTTPSEEGKKPDGRLEVILKDSDGTVLARHEVPELSRNGLFFSVGFPEALQGDEGALEVVWWRGDNVVGRAEAPFHVQEPGEVARSGRIPLRVLNEPGTTVANAPMTVGVPFPQGALDDVANVRLVDETGAEVPLQARETALWSRFGSIKWLLCDFTVDLDGGPREVYLEYGPDLQRAEGGDIVTGDLAGGFPALDAGRVRIDHNGLSFDSNGDGAFTPVLSPQAMLGAFVNHENGRTYTMPADAEYAFEELGSEKAVVRRTGWYRHADSGEEFCNFVTRFVFHRNSPVVRIFHTWIFTGDGNRERIADMGWRFDAAQSTFDGGILTAFEEGEWVSGESLVQFDYQRFLFPESGTEREGRTPGVLSVVVGDTRATFGAKDFWQNFPSELEVGEDGFVFYNWPRRNPPARLERPVAREDAFRSRFVHEGGFLDFRIPDEYAEGPIWRESSRREGHIAEGRPESVNAQGIARTEEMFLYFTDADLSADEAAKVIQGLNDETLRAVVEPAWVCATGVFGDIHHRDPENYPELERIAELALTAPPRWVERLGFYGMWVHGDYPTWNINLGARTVSTYRTLRKNHHAYPYGWVPFARSGNPELLKLAETAARQMTDANFCHYASADVDDSVGPDHFRRQGWWDRSLLPWAGRSGPHLRSYTVDSDYLWHAYYMTGYGRARDVALLFGDLTQRDHNWTVATMPGRTRAAESMLVSYLDMYQATFDPWFLDAMHEIGAKLAHLYGDEERVDQWTPRPDLTGHTLRTANQRLYRFTGNDLHRHMALNNAMAWTSPRSAGARFASPSGWGGARQRGNLAAFAWSLTGDEFYLKRVAASLEAGKLMVYEGETDYLRGTPEAIGHGNVLWTRAGWDQIGVMQHAIKRAGRLPEPLHDPFLLSGSSVPDEEGVYHFNLPILYVRKDGPEAVPLLLDAAGRGRDGVWPREQHGPFSYEVLNREGETVSRGQWRAPAMTKIPAGIPEGIYRVNVFGRIPYPDEEELLENWRRADRDEDIGNARARFQRNHNRIFFPLGKPGTPEVMVFAPGDEGTSVEAPGQGYHFKVPEGVGEFWIEFRRSGGGRAPVNRVSVWNPDGERVYDRSYVGDPPDRVTMEVPPGQDGELWRATGGPFIIDPRIPPYFSVSRSKWFNPEQK